MIRSKIHKLVEVMDPGPTSWLFQTDPLYIFDQDIVDLLITSESATKSFTAMAEAGLVHLPYPEMTVQWDSNSKKGTWFASIREKEGTFEVINVFLFTSGEIAESVGLNKVKITPEQFDIEMVGNEQVYGYAAAVSVRLACLMTHIAGLEREVVEPTRLNKVREKKGKPRIKSYEYIHIARVYDRSGKAHAYTGRHMPIHMRAGHVRNQPCGKERSERKLIWIPPVLVNYKDGDKPVVEKRVVR